MLPGISRFVWFHSKLIISSVGFRWQAWCSKACMLGTCEGKRSWLVGPEPYVRSCRGGLLRRRQHSVTAADPCACQRHCWFGLIKPLPRMLRFANSWNLKNYGGMNSKTKLSNRKTQTIFLPINCYMEHVSYWYFSVAWAEISRSLLLQRSYIKRGVC